MARFGTSYLVGNFNFPGIDWYRLTPTSRDTCTADFCDMLNDIFWFNVSLTIIQHEC